MDALPEWEEGTPAVLIVAGPHVIPVSTSVRRGDRRITLALGRRRETLRRLREDPAVAVAMIGRGLAFTAYGSGRVVRDPLDAAPVVGVAIDVDRIEDHLVDGRTQIDDGARWTWLDSVAAEADPLIRAELHLI